MNAVEFERARSIIESRTPGRSDKWRKRALAKLVQREGVEVVSTGRRVIAYKLPNGQAVCHKRRFQCEETALETLRQIAAEHEPRKQPIRAYPCYVCFGWHITSKPR